MHYVVGLGNPGTKYEATRHNVGFCALDALVGTAGLPSFVDSKKYSGLVSEGMLNGSEVTLLKPTTYMNNSGTAVRKLVPKDEEKKVILIYDDVDIPPGEIKVSFGRGSGGHNGVGSVIEALNTRDFARIRIGIAKKNFFGRVTRPKGEKLSDHVLGSIKKQEETLFDDAYKKAHKALELIVNDGIEKAMQVYN